jgi:hypothetical protein
LISASWASLRGEATATELVVDRVEAGDLGSLAGELVVLEAPPIVPELVGLEGVASGRTGFLGDFNLTGEVVVAAAGKILLRFAAGVELAGLAAGVLGRTGMVLVRLLGVIADDFPSAVPGLAMFVVLGALAGVLGLTLVELGVLAAAVGLAVLLGVDVKDGREARRGADNRSARACCSFLRLSIALRRVACGQWGRGGEEEILDYSTAK